MRDKEKGPHQEPWVLAAPPPRVETQGWKAAWGVEQPGSALATLGYLFALVCL